MRVAGHDSELFAVPFPTPTLSQRAGREESPAGKGKIEGGVIARPREENARAGFRCEWARPPSRWEGLIGNVGGLRCAAERCRQDGATRLFSTGNYVR
jgi:hypothetical protein